MEKRTEWVTLTPQQCKAIRQIYGHMRLRRLHADHHIAYHALFPIVKLRQRRIRQRHWQQTLQHLHMLSREISIIEEGGYGYGYD